MKCDKCNNVADYSDKYDRQYCATCNIWLESKCSCDPKALEYGRVCQYANLKHPEKPLKETENE